MGAGEPRAWAQGALTFEVELLEIQDPMTP